MSCSPEVWLDVRPPLPRPHTAAAPATVCIYPTIKSLAAANRGAGSTFGDQLSFNGLRKCCVKINVETYFSSAREIEYFI